MKKRRALIIANAPAATLPPNFEPAPDDLIIAADGGTRHVLRWGWRLDWVVGDLDSLPEGSRARLESQNIRFLISPVRKDETDLEMALQVAAEEGAGKALIFGALGGRADHMLANILLLEVAVHRGMTATILEGMQSLHLIHSGEEGIFAGQPGDILSLMALTGDAIGITTSHLDYSLDDDTLPFGKSLGISNVFTGKEAQVRLQEGRLLAVHIRQR